MLEHAIEAEEPKSNAAPPPPPAEFYVPKHNAQALNGSAPAPRVKRFSRKMLLGVTVVTSLVILLAVKAGLETPPPAKAPELPATPEKPPAANAAVNSLPDRYDEVLPLGDRQPGDLGAVNAGATGLGGNAAPRQLTPLEQYAEQAQLDELRNEDRARAAAVSFANAGGEAAIAAQVSPGASDAAQLQERLLEWAQHGGGAAGAVPTAPNTAGREDANRQDEKSDFVDRTRDSNFELHTSVQKPKSPYTLFAGTILPCVMTQGIDSDLPGQIGCMISQNVYDTVTGRYLLLPQGTKVIGTYDSRVAYGQERVLVVWTRLLRPDGSTLSLEGMPGVDLSGYAGLAGHVNNHYGRLLAGVVLGSLLGASAQIAVGANSSNPGFAELAMQGAGQNINEAGQQITRKNLNIQPTIEVPPGARLNIFVTQDLILPPWTE
jgi:type IV secretion system protein VirB10